jgi:tetratricopeptide (TPR) repeat protein
MKVEMTEKLAIIKQCEERIEKALYSLEMVGELSSALVVYRDVGSELSTMVVPPEHATHFQRNRVLAYCLMRQANIFRQMGKADKVLELGKQEIIAARASRDDLTLARSTLSYGTNLIVSGEIERGLAMIEKASTLFERGDSYDFKQGLGWYWILRADLGNAGLVEKQPSEIIRAAEQALEILLPIQNWPGVARAYAARAQVYERIGDSAAAAEDRVEQQRYEDKVVSTEGSAT